MLDLFILCFRSEFCHDCTARMAKMDGRGPSLCGVCVKNDIFVVLACFLRVSRRPSSLLPRFWTVQVDVARYS